MDPAVRGGGARSAAPTHPDPPDADIIIDTDPTHRYICFKQELGKGAFKTVHKAFDEVDGIEVAWSKVSIDDMPDTPGNVESVYSEVRLLKALNHKNIMKYYASWTDEKTNTVNIITELFTSGSLRQYRKKHQKVDIKAVKGWARQILTGLCYLHSQNPPIIHRDLKCDNIFINGSHGEVKIGDLGFATIMAQPMAKSVIGTPEFMAPELYDEEYNELVDIYSFGMCMLEMVTFEYPYKECKNSCQIFKKVSMGVKPAALSKVKDPEIKSFIEKCLGPAAERLPARDLLKHSFLQLDGSNRIQGHHHLDDPDIVMPTVASRGDSSFVSEGTTTNLQKMPSFMDTDDDDNQPPLVPVTENSSGYGSLEVQKKKKDSEFRLRGERSDTHFIELNLQIDDRRGRTRKAHSLIYLNNNDTAILIAGRMVAQLELPKKDVEFIAELIDLLMTSLIPRWKSCIAIDHLKSLAGTHCLIDEPKDLQLVDCRENSIESFQNIFEAAPTCINSNSTESSSQPLHDASVNVRLDDIEAHVDLESFTMAVSDDQDSVLSFFSAISSSGNGIMSPCACMYSSLGQVDTSGHKMEGNNGTQEPCRVENGMPLDQKCMDMIGVSDLPAFSNFMGNVSSVVVGDEDEVDEMLRNELELIELHYQQALTDLYQKQQQAILNAKRMAAQRKQSLLS